MRGHRYGGDPYWVTAKFPGTCAASGCNEPIKPGDQIYYYPQGKRAFAKPCGHAEANANDFEAHRFDEEQYGS